MDFCLWGSLKKHQINKNNKFIELNMKVNSVSLSESLQVCTYEEFDIVFEVHYCWNLETEVGPKCRQDTGQRGWSANDNLIAKNPGKQRPRGQSENYKM